MTHIITDHTGMPGNAPALQPTSLLTGRNIRLRALEPADVDLLFAWENDPSVWKISNTLAPFSRFQLEEYVLNTQNDIFATKQLRLMIDLVNTADGTVPVGTIDLFDFEPIHSRAGVGILIREVFQRRGYATEAMEIFIRYAFGTLHLHQLYCNISPENSASLTLFEKCGFSRCGVKKEWNYDGRHFADEWIYQLIRGDA
jgi:diamine N-acetyltransferase